MALQPDFPGQSSTPSHFAEHCSNELPVHRPLTRSPDPPSHTAAGHSALRIGLVPKPAAAPCVSLDQPVRSIDWLAVRLQCPREQSLLIPARRPSGPP